MGRCSRSWAGTGLDWSEVTVHHLTTSMGWLSILGSWNICVFIPHLSTPVSILAMKVTITTHPPTCQPLSCQLSCIEVLGWSHRDAEAESIDLGIRRPKRQHAKIIGHGNLLSSLDLVMVAWGISLLTAWHSGMEDKMFSARPASLLGPHYNLLDLLFLRPSGKYGNYLHHGTPSRIRHIWLLRLLRNLICSLHARLARLGTWWPRPLQGSRTSLYRHMLQARGARFIPDTGSRRAPWCTTLCHYLAGSFSQRRYNLQSHCPPRQYRTVHSH